MLRTADRLNNLRVAGCAAAFLWAGVQAAVPEAADATGAILPGEPPRYHSFDVSPQGRRLLILKAQGEAYDLVVRDLDPGVPIQPARTIYEHALGQGLLNWCRWANEERILCSLREYRPSGRAGQIIRTRILALNHDGTALKRLVPRAKTIHRRAPAYNSQIQDRVLSWLPADPAGIMIQLNRDDPNRPSVYRLDIYTNELTRIRKARKQVRRWYANHEGRILLAMGYEDDTDPVLYRVAGRQLVRYADPAFQSEIPPVPIGYSLDGERVFMNMTNGADKHGVFNVRLADGAVLGKVFTDPQFDVFARLVLDPGTGEPSGVHYLTHHPQMVWFDRKAEALFENVRRALPGSQLEIVTNDTAYTRFVLRTYGGIVPRYYLYDRPTGEIELIGREYAGFDDAKVVDLEPVSYTSRDGTPIPAYLAVPHDRAARRLPTILFPHGGPYARDSAEFDDWTQFFIERGYAVLKPNYRGSVGYGEYYMRAGYRQWGLKMQEDLLDGLEWLVQRGISDPQRVCVVGSSFGGYSALVAAFKNADRIQCAVSMGGIADLEKLVERIQRFDLVERNLVRIQSGEALEENSPIHQAERFGVPVLLVHGAQDTVVGTSQSRRLAEALEELDKPVEYIEQPAGDHFLSGRTERLQFFDAMGRFLDRHIGSMD